MIENYIGGQWTASQGTNSFAVVNPATTEELAQCPMGTAADVDAAVAAAQAAFPAWRQTPVSDRVQYLFRLKQLLEEHAEELARCITTEHGKTLVEARGSVRRGIQMVETACGMPTLMMGDILEDIAAGIDSQAVRRPMGVFAGIAPFNFPAMVPMWFWPFAIAAGNTFVLKPAEKDPSCTMLLAKLFKQAGLPDGVFNIVHGGKEAVDTILEDPRISAVSFVGSTPIAQYIYTKASENGKRVQALGGAKNHMVVMPDAPKDQVVSALAGAACGAAGQRCMAISVAVLVGEAGEWEGEIAQRISELKPGEWTDKESAYGPLISAQARERVLSLIDGAKRDGATCLVDGSGFTVPHLPNGHWVGPTVFSDVTIDMEIYQQEIFGPVLIILKAKNLEEAIDLINQNQFGNGTSIFTGSGYAARTFQQKIKVGQVGINVPIPVPMPFFSFTGWRGSFYGDQHAYGKQAVRFYTETKNCN